MGYAHIENLYREAAQIIFMFRECFALEKIHGTSAHVSWKDGEVKFFAGGENHTNFVALFDLEKLKELFTAMGKPEVTVYGEAYGGKQQGMSGTYGKNLKFIAFDVEVGDRWLSVPDAETVAKSLGLEFVFYVKIPTEWAAIDAERDAPSVQAVRNGITEPKKREGVVLRPVIEVTTNNGGRIVAKHKGAEFQETKTPRSTDPAKLQVLSEAGAVADEWVTEMRLTHVLDKIPAEQQVIENMRNIIAAMVEDVLREGSGEIVDSKEVRGAIGKKSATMFKERLNERARAKTG